MCPDRAQESSRSVFLSDSVLTETQRARHAHPCSWASGVTAPSPAAGPSMEGHVCPTPKALVRSPRRGEASRGRRRGLGSEQGEWGGGSRERGRQQGLPLQFCRFSSARLISDRSFAHFHNRSRRHARRPVLWQPRGRCCGNKMVKDLASHSHRGGRRVAPHGRVNHLQGSHCRPQQRWRLREGPGTEPPWRGDEGGCPQGLLQAEV